MSCPDIPPVLYGPPAHPEGSCYTYIPDTGCWLSDCMLEKVKEVIIRTETPSSPMGGRKELE